MTRPFLLAVISCLGLGTIFYGSVYVFTSDVHLSEGLGALPLIAIHSLAEGIEKRSAGSKKSNIYAKHYSFDRFMVSWYWILFIGTATIVAFANLITLFAGSLTLAASSSIKSDQTLAVLGGIILIPTLAYAYTLGRWTGVRSRAGGWMLVIAYSVLGSAVMHVFDYLFTDNAIFQLLFGGRDKGLGLLAVQILGGAALYGAPGLIGFWRGRQAQQGEYVSHLIRLLPKDTRDVVTSMIVDEVGRLPATPPKPAPTSGAPAALGPQTS
jgi:hypothetical protein